MDCLSSLSNNKCCTPLSVVATGAGLLTAIAGLALYFTRQYTGISSILSLKILTPTGGVLLFVGGTTFFCLRANKDEPVVFERHGVGTCQYKPNSFSACPFNAAEFNNKLLILFPHLDTLPQQRLSIAFDEFHISHFTSDLMTGTDRYGHRFVAILGSGEYCLIGYKIRGEVPPPARAAAGQDAPPPEPLDPPPEPSYDQGPIAYIRYAATNDRKMTVPLYQENLEHLARFLPPPHRSIRNSLLSVFSLLFLNKCF